jgi:F-type H+-transporting ATPase subunit delta
MNNIGKEYGTALFALACESGSQESYARSLEEVRTVFAQNPDYAEFLSSPSVLLSERLASVDTCFGDSAPEHVVSMLKLLCEKRRIFCLGEAIDEYMALLDASRHVSSAKITSAVPLTDDQKRRLIQKLESVCNAKVNAEYFVDEAVLGGLVVEIDGKVMDGTLRQRLRNVKEVINT